MTKMSISETIIYIVQIKIAVLFQDLLYIQGTYWTVSMHM